MITSVFDITKLKEWLDVVVTIVCWHTMALVVALQEDESVLSVYRNLQIFVKRPPVVYKISSIASFDNHIPSLACHNNKVPQNGSCVISCCM